MIFPLLISPVQAELKVVGESGAGLVRATMNGQGVLEAISVDEKIRSDPDVSEKLIIEAVNIARAEVETARQKEVEGLAAIVASKLV